MDEDRVYTTVLDFTVCRHRIFLLLHLFTYTTMQFVHVHARGTMQVRFFLRAHVCSQLSQFCYPSPLHTPVVPSRQIFDRLTTAVTSRAACIWS